MTILSLNIKKPYEKMISRYRVAGTFENLSKAYATDLDLKQKKVDSLTEQLKVIKQKVKQYTDFVENHGLL